MDEWSILYDNTENTQTRYIGYLGSSTRFDVAITVTAHFYGKSLVTVIQNGKTAIIGNEDAANPEYLMEAFAIQNRDEAEEFSDFLTHNL